MQRLKVIFLAHFTALAIGALFYVFNTYFIRIIGVPAWENSLGITLAFAVILASTAATGIFLQSRKVFIPGLLTVSVFCAVVGALGPIGAATGFLLGLGLATVIWGTQRFLVPIPTAILLTFEQSVIHSAIVTALIGLLWILLTAPAFAEGFVLLSWILLGAFNLFVFLTFTVVVPGRCLGPEFSARYILKLGGAVVFAVVLGGSGVFYLMWSEGEVMPPLKSSANWDGAFVPFSDIPEEVEAEVTESRFTKADFVRLLRAQDHLSFSQSATLYLLTGGEEEALQFKIQILKAAAELLYAGEEGSVKYGQRYAMLWALYYEKISKKTPALFSYNEKIQIEGWFSLIAQRIMNPGWVDYLYAIPFRSMPYGPYLNQEIGAGALALLSGYVADASPEFLERTAEFTDHLTSGWQKTYRNQDDSFGYQDVWMGSSMEIWRSRQVKAVPPGLTYANKWIMSQLPKHVFPLNYGLAADVRPLDSLAIGAFLLRDPQSRWLLEEHLIEISRLGEQLPNELVALHLWDDDGNPSPFNPRSVMISAPTGYTFRPGELAPDKIVMRDTVGEDQASQEMYALVNLRSSGWHRYPSTNTLIRLAFGRFPILVEALVSKTHGWLPKGRAKHRDKKVNRSRLNGLAVERTGLDALVGGLTGIGSRWRQDVPRFATPGFVGDTGEFQFAQVQLDGWDGVTQTRTYFMVSGGTFGIFDQISDIETRDKAINWYFSPMPKERDCLKSREQKCTRWDYKIFSSDNTKVTARRVKEWLPGALKSAPVDEHVQLTSDAIEFSSMMLVSAGDASPELKLEYNDEKTAVLKYSTLSQNYEMAFPQASHWDYRGIQTDARIARYSFGERLNTIDFIDASFVDIGDHPQARSMSWSIAKNGEDEKYVVEGSLSLKFDTRRHVRLRFAVTQ